MERLKDVARKFLAVGGIVMAGIGALGIYGGAATESSASVEGGIALAVIGLTTMVFGLES